MTSPEDKQLALILETYDMDGLTEINRQRVRRGLSAVWPIRTDRINTLPNYDHVELRWVPSETEPLRFRLNALHPTQITWEPPVDWRPAPCSALPRGTIILTIIMTNKTGWWSARAGQYGGESHLPGFDPDTLR